MAESIKEACGAAEPRIKTDEEHAKVVREYQEFLERAGAKKVGDIRTGPPPDPKEARKRAVEALKTMTSAWHAQLVEEKKEPP